MGEHAVPVACTLTSSGADRRLGEWRDLLADVVTRAGIDNGLRLTFGSAPASAVADLAQRELACCAFFDFRIGFDAGRVTLDVQAPPDARAIVDELFGSPA